MKKVISVLFTCLIMVTHVQAETRHRGVVEKVDLESGLIKINNNHYKIKHGKTRLFSGKQKLGLARLSKGSRVIFELDNAFITKIRLINPVKFDE